MDRHDLAYLHQHANIYFLELSIPEQVKQKVRKLLKNNVPLTVCRQEQIDVGQVKLAISCFVAGQKYRIALTVDSVDILKITRPVALQHILSQFPPLTVQSLARFLTQMLQLNCEVYIYGSYAYQYLTQEQYLNAGSDLDMVLYPDNNQHFNEILGYLGKLKNEIDICIDGELKIHPEWHVSFNEMIQILPDLDQQIIAKGIKQIGLIPLKELLGWMHADTRTTT